ATPLGGNTTSADASDATRGVHGRWISAERLACEIHASVEQLLRCLALPVAHVAGDVERAVVLRAHAEAPADLDEHAELVDAERAGDGRELGAEVLERHGAPPFVVDGA